MFDPFLLVMEFEPLTLGSRENQVDCNTTTDVKLFCLFGTVGTYSSP